MVWTYLRSCYKFNLRLFVGGVEKIYPAQWFFCDPNALRFPSPHGAEASPWLREFEVNQNWGEVTPYKGLSRGINPGYPGLCSVGDPQWFIDGQLPASIAEWKTPVLTPCCGHVPPDNTDSRCPQPPPICQPYLHPPMGMVLTCSAGSFIFTFFNPPPIGAQGFCIVTTSDPHVNYEVLIGLDTPAPCLGAAFATQFTARQLENLPPLYTFEFVSYDPVTRIGRAQMDFTAPVVGGQIWDFQWL